MKILFLDDMQERHDIFAKNNKNHEITHVFTATDCLNHLISDGPFDIISLDHDLGDAETVFTDYGKFEKNGTFIANKMIENISQDKWPKNIIIHSWNVGRRQAMQDIFADHGFSSAIIPFDDKPIPVCPVCTVNFQVAGHSGLCVACWTEKAING